tara:strand:+ start:646 stop:771 length:126 start_codon:yes stop_codon:yes gene_type:complete
MQLIKQNPIAKLLKNSFFKSKIFKKKKGKGSYDRKKNKNYT